MYETSSKPYGSAGQVPKPESEIQREQRGLAQNTEALAQTVTTLIERLSPVIMQKPQAVPGTERDKEEGCYSEVARGIGAARMCVQSQTARLRDVIESLAI